MELLLLSKVILFRFGSVREVLAFHFRDRASFVRLAVLDVVLAHPLHLDILLKPLRIQGFNLQSPPTLPPFLRSQSVLLRIGMLCHRERNTSHLFSLEPNKVSQDD